MKSQKHKHIDMQYANKNNKIRLLLYFMHRIILQKYFAYQTKIQIMQKDCAINIKMHSP